MSNVLAKMPNISIPRSRFKQPFNHSTSFEHGKLVPIDCFEILPGDNYSLTLSSLIRMSTPIVPIFGNIECFLHAFFVPMRLLWQDAEKFYGDPSNHNKVASITPVALDGVTIPQWNPVNGTYTQSQFCKSVAAYLGKPYVASGDLNGNNAPFISNLKERGYYIIWNEYFRPSNLIKPNIVSMTGGKTNDIGLDYDNIYIGYYHPCLPVCKKYDYFTAMTLSPQFGNSVSLPLGSYAPLKVDLSDGTYTGINYFGINATNGNATYNLFGNYSSGATLDNSDNVYGKASFYVDLNSATAATINSIRYAFQVQKYLERSNYGSRFFEILNAHYGVTSPDGRLQRPDRLGYHKFYINVSQVLATATSTDGSGTSNLGQTGAVSVTGDKCHLFDAAFTEPGYLYVLLCTKYDRSYSGGILREDKRKYRLEFYSPEFANLGDMEVFKNEIAFYYNFTSHQYNGDDAVFGFQEHWAEYRYRKDRVSGILNPTSTVQSGVSNLAFWTLSDVFDSLDSNSANISLSPSFLFEDRDSLARCLVTGVNGPDYIADFHFDYLATRELPLYSIPGLIDHFGAL